METAVEEYWKKRLLALQKALEKNSFEVFLAQDPAEAKEIILEKILAKIPCKSVSWGDSISMHSTNILKEVEKNPDIELIKTFETGVPRDEILERRRQALVVDVFFTGSNAVTESGKLVNLDMVGNRVAGLTYGPKHVVVIIGRNKIVKDVEEAMHRIKNYAAPINAIRHTGFKTPCIKTSFCSDCNSPDRICNTWTITEKAYPPKRVKVVVVNKEVGL